MKGKLFKRTLAVAVSVLMLTGGVSLRPYSGIFEDVAITAIAESNVTYLDAVGASQTCPTYTTVADSTTAWNEGWYVVSSNTTIAGRVSVSGTVNLILCDGATLTASNGITVGNRATFNVYAQSEDEATMGVLNATTSEPNNAGIGGTKSSSAGAITINGGKITARGYNGAGIGSGCRYTVGTITINGGIIDAEDSNRYGAGIGGGSYGGNAGVIDLNGGIINAKGIGSGYCGGDSAITVNISSGVKEIVATSVQNGACIGQGNGASGSVNVVFKNNGSVVTGDAKDAVFYDSGEGTSRTIRSKVTNHSISISDEIKASVTADVSVAPQGSTVTLTLSMNVDESTLRVNDGTRDLTLTDIGNRQFTFVMPDADVTVTAIAQGEITYKLADGTPQTVSDFTVITNETTWSSGTYAVTADTTISDRVTVSGEVHLILCDGATLTCEKGITVAGDDSLTIYGCTAGTGTLTATADSRFSGIGGGDSQSGGTITINGGNISATGKYGAGIGGGMYAAGGNVTINGGTVTANSSNGGAGIGGGSCAGGSDPSVNTDGGMITINGGTVTATGGSYGAGIGGGERGAGGTITIRGGSITTNGGRSGAGIGGGNHADGGTISITGGTVTATGGTYGAGIGGGSGSEGAGGNITISGGNVDATGGSGAAGIGGGDDCTEGTITLGWTNATDSIKATSYNGTVTFAKAFMIENGTRATTDNIPGQTLSPLKSNVTIASGITNGTVSADKTSDVLFGETVTLTVTPDTGYGVKHVKYNDIEITPVNGVYSFTMPAENATVTAEFDETEYTITVSESAHGTVSANAAAHYGETVTLTVTPDTGWAIESISVNGTVIEPVNDVYSFAMPAENVTVNATFFDMSLHFSMDGDTYTIHDALGWSYFCDCLLDSAAYNGFAGKTVMLSESFSDTVTRAAGTRENPFKGTFDGNGKTLNVSINDTSEQGTAPFRAFGGGAVIKDLTVTGTVTGHTHAAGLVGFSEATASGQTNTIDNCVVSVTVNNPLTAGYRHIGGIVGHGLCNSLAIKNTVWNGSMSNTADYAGGLMGWCDSEASLTLENCISMGTYTGSATNGFHPVAIMNAGSQIAHTENNCYYTTDPTLKNSNYIAASGKRMHTFALDDNATMVFSGTAVEHSVSGITAYATGIGYNGNFYAGAGDWVTLNITRAEDGGTSNNVFVNYGAVSVTENEDGTYSFTMPDADAIVMTNDLVYYSVFLPVGMEIVSVTNNAIGTGKYISGTTVSFRVAFPYTASNISDGTNTLTANDGVYSVTVGDADITVTADIQRNSQIDLSLAPDNFTVIDGDVLTGSTNHTVRVADNAKITLSNATINGGIICEGSAEITLVGTNSVTGAAQKAGIQIGGSGTTLTIKGNGSLTATGGKYGAGIGLDSAWGTDVTGGNIVIESGNITATGGTCGAGIGTGALYDYQSEALSVSMGDIVVNGGTVTANGNVDSGTGIGAGLVYGFKASSLAIGKIVLNGGEIAASGRYGIGYGTPYGMSGQSDATITIEGLYIDTGIELVDATSIRDFENVVYTNNEIDVTTNKTDYFTIIEDGDRRIIEKKDYTDYTITITDNTEHGTLSGETTAKYADVVTITATPEFGYRLSRLVVKDAQNNNVASVGNSFVMPKSNVTVSAVFEEGAHGTTEFKWNWYNYNLGREVEETIYDGVTTVELQQGQWYQILKYNEYGYRRFLLDNDTNNVTIPYSGGTGVFISGNGTSFSIPANGETGFYDITMTDANNGKWRVSIQKTVPVIDNVPDQFYAGGEIKPEPMVLAGSLNLIKGTDYEYSYTDNINVGTAKVIVTFKGDYASLGSVEKEFNILPNMIFEKVAAQPATCTAPGNIEYFTGSDGKLYIRNGAGYAVTTPEAVTVPMIAHTYGEPVWTWDGYASASATFTCGGCGDVQTEDAAITSVRTEPTEDANGSIVYTATVSFNGQEYTDVKTEILYKLNKTDISGFRLIANTTSFAYVGEEHTVNIWLKRNDGTYLTEGVDYTVSGNTATEKGTYTLTVKGIGAYSGTIYAVWRIGETFCVTANTGSGIKTTYYDEKTSATVKADNIEGQKFKCWQSDGKILSYSKNYSFIVLRDIELEAVYVDESEEVIPEPVLDIVAIKTTYNGMNAIGLELNHSVPNNLQVTEVGIQYATNKGLGYTIGSDYAKVNLLENTDYNVSDLLKAQANHIADYKNNNGRFVFSVGVGNNIECYVYGIGYVKYLENGVERVKYCDSAIAVTYNTID